MLQDDIARNFDAQIDNEKDGQDNVVAVTDEVEICCHAFNLGVSAMPDTLVSHILSACWTGAPVSTDPILARSMAQHMSW